MSKVYDFLRSSPLLLGSILAAVVYVFPEAKPIACGGIFALPSLVN